MSKDFSVSIRMITWFPFLSLSAHPWNETTQTTSIIFYMFWSLICKCFGENFCILAHKENYFTAPSFHWCVLIWFGYQGDTGFKERNWQHFSPFCFSESFEYFSSLLDFWMNSPVDHLLLPGLSFWGNNFATVSIILLNTDLFELFVSSWFNVDRSYVVWKVISNLSACSFSNLLDNIFSNNSIMPLWTWVTSVAMSPFPSPNFVSLFC